MSTLWWRSSHEHWPLLCRPSGALVQGPSGMKPIDRYKSGSPALCPTAATEVHALGILKATACALHGASLLPWPPRWQENPPLWGRPASLVCPQAHPRRCWAKLRPAERWPDSPFRGGVRGPRSHRGSGEQRRGATTRESLNLKTLQLPPGVGGARTWPGGGCLAGGARGRLPPRLW